MTVWSYVAVLNYKLQQSTGPSQWKAGQGPSDDNGNYDARWWCQNYDGNDHNDDDVIFLLVQMTNVLEGPLSIGPHPPQESQETVYRVSESIKALFTMSLIWHLYKFNSKGMDYGVQFLWWHLCKVCLSTFGTSRVSSHTVMQGQ